MSIKAGTTSTTTLWTTKGSTTVSDTNIDLFREIGLRCRPHKGNIFMIRSLKFLLKGELVSDKHVQIYTELGTQYFKTVKPTADEEEPSPFSRILQVVQASVPVPTTTIRPYEPESDTSSEEDGNFFVFGLYE
jgi:hypothetical protein